MERKIHTYIHYIYIYIEREREKDRKRERKLTIDEQHDFNILKPGGFVRI